MLSLTKVKIKAGDTTIIEDFSFNFLKNKIYVIMGPNGSGKSTLAHAIMGNPTYQVVNGEMFITHPGSSPHLKKIDLNSMSADERADAGIFMAFQSPLSLAGVRVAQLLLMAMKGRKSALQIKKEIDEVSAMLRINKDILNRSLNDGLSGGERKKMEVLQASILDKRLLIFDEIDTGVDVDAMKHIADFLQTKRKGRTLIIITHYNRILRYIRPDKVLIVANGKLVKVGDYTLAEMVERDGYRKILV
jgi:Fe-S cluster assembly ATP-binding protein